MDDARPMPLTTAYPLWPSPAERTARAGNAPRQAPATRLQNDAGDLALLMNAPQGEDADRHLSFDALVAKYEKQIFNLIYRNLGDYEEAVDLTQETFINAYRHYDRFRGDSKVYTWLYQIARNLCINRVRQRDRQRALRIESLDQPRAADDEGSAREVPDWTHAPQAVLEDKELRQKLLAAIDSLPPDYREVVVLREFQHLSYNEIVEVTGLTLENVKTRLSRARAMLRRKLEPYYRG